MENFPKEEAYQPILETVLPLTRKVRHVLTPVKLSDSSLKQETVIRHTSSLKAANKLIHKVIHENCVKNKLEVKGSTYVTLTPRIEDVSKEDTMS